MKKYVTSVLLYTQLLNLCNVNWAELCLPRAALSAPLPLFSHGAGQQFLLPSLAENGEMRLRCFPASLCSRSKENRQGSFFTFSLDTCPWVLESLSRNLYSCRKKWRMSGCVWYLFHSLKSAGEHRLCCTKLCLQNWDVTAVYFVLHALVF